MTECCAKGQKESGRCLRLSQCCATSSSSSPDSVKGATLRSNSRYTSSQSRRATANRQVCSSSRHLRLHLGVCKQVFNTAQCFLYFCYRVESEGCGTTQFVDRLSLLSLLQTLLLLQLSTEVKFAYLITRFNLLCLNNVRFIFFLFLPSAALGNHFLTNQMLQTHTGASPYDTILAKGYNQPFSSTGTSTLRSTQFLYVCVVVLTCFLIKACFIKNIKCILSNVYTIIKQYVSLRLVL